MQNHTQLPTGLSFSYETERLILRLPSTDYLREIHDFLYRNRSCFEKYEPTAPENYYTLDFQQTLARCELKLALKLSSVRFYVFFERRSIYHHRHGLSAQYYKNALFHE